MSGSFVLPFVKKEQIAKNTWTFFFDRTVVSNYFFLPGQYAKVTLPIAAKDGKGSYRFFTIASSPLDKSFLKITTKISVDSNKRSDFKNTLFNLNPGTNVNFFGPMGGFFLDENNITQRVLLAGGIGITPFYSMILYALEKGFSIPLTLIASFSKEKDIIFKEDLTKAVRKNKNIRLIYTISSEEKEKNSWIPHQVWDDNLEIGRISDKLIKKYIADIQIPIFMVSGKPGMIDSTVEMLEKMGIDESKIKTDIFTGY